MKHHMLLLGLLGFFSGGAAAVAQSTPGWTDQGDGSMQYVDPAGAFFCQATSSPPGTTYRELIITLWSADSHSELRLITRYLDGCYSTRDGMLYRIIVEQACGSPPQSHICFRPSWPTPP